MSDYISRLEVEHTELSDRLEKLSAFLNQKKPEFVTAWQWAQMQEQKMHMAGYKRVLFLSRLCGGEYQLARLAAIVIFLSRLCGGE